MSIWLCIAVAFFYVMRVVALVAIGPTALRGVLRLGREQAECGPKKVHKATGTRSRIVGKQPSSAKPDGRSHRGRQHYPDRHRCFIMWALWLSRENSVEPR